MYISLYTACILGVLSHIFYFLHGEHHLLSFVYFQVLIFAPIIAILGIYTIDTSFDVSTVANVALFEAVFLFSLWSSIIVYRICPFHRLWSFPGPISWRLTKLTEAWCNRNLRGFEVLDRLHRQHGDLVRTGEKKAHALTDLKEKYIDAAHRTLRVISARP